MDVASFNGGRRPERWSVVGRPGRPPQPCCWAMFHRAPPLAKTSA